LEKVRAVIVFWLFSKSKGKIILKEFVSFISLSVGLISKYFILDDYYRGGSDQTVRILAGTFQSVIVPVG